MRDILIHTHGTAGRKIGHISLNRPKAIHSLTMEMCEAMIEALLAWRDDDAVKAVILDHAEGRGFCAGGDVTLLRNSALEDAGKSGRAFFHTEYQLNHLLFTYPRPVVAFMDGITMGGGVGISQPARFRVVTENTRYAMPETGIGLICDVGGGWYLSRLPGQLGKFLGLTGARLDGAECLWAGLGTYYLESGALAEAKARIIEKPDEIGDILDALASEPPEARLRGNMDTIDRLFAADTLAGIMDALEADGGEWATKELKTLRSKSPMTCELVLRQLREGAEAPDFAHNMAMEYRAAGRAIMLPDFAEGVRALIVDKTGDPAWKPARVADIDPKAVDAVFAPLPPEEEWKPL
ncbi:enoyl-CoA hydratase/isomerase family protein [Croceicoccus marinus]|jgi:enoyl-CoA hydratase|uniref:3-hydroxyisobutyryl-CoA hydrolase n=1 Tax=Croceicoccus marinus TaxID=450378 RepID=A0A7G6VQH8_9SPHN|nr:enoyl-CoA hydratase/isomerase family protein [Croceicoccus marinus]QNE03993.1 enoyl-CoA hydratase/isomerase family protein [Croceicoccus marinus]